MIAIGVDLVHDLRDLGLRERGASETREQLELVGVERTVAVGVELREGTHRQLALLQHVELSPSASTEPVGADVVAIRRSHFRQPPRAQLLKVDLTVLVDVAQLKRQLQLNRIHVTTETVGEQRELKHRQTTISINVEFLKLFSQKSYVCVVL